MTDEPPDRIARPLRPATSRPLWIVGVLAVNAAVAVGICLPAVACFLTVRVALHSRPERIAHHLSRAPLGWIVLASAIASVTYIAARRDRRVIALFRLAALGVLLVSLVVLTTLVPLRMIS